jgi:hypothetical protein
MTSKVCHAAAVVNCDWIVDNGQAGLEGALLLSNTLIFYPCNAACAISQSHTASLPCAPAVRTPPLLHLGMHNSLNDDDCTASGSSRVTLFAPYWLNNRTGGAAGGICGFTLTPIPSG